MKGFEGSSVSRFFIINLLRVFFLNFLFSESKKTLDLVRPK